MAGVNDGLPKGLLPVMLTPFTEDGSAVDYEGLTRLTEWYIKNGAVGLFSVAQTSEMHQLSQEERVKVATTVMEVTAGRVPVVASGTFGEVGDGMAEYVKQIAATGVAAVVILPCMLVTAEEDDALLIERVNRLLELTPGIALGIYECPAPYHRVLLPETLLTLAATGRFIFHKDTSRHNGTISKKLELLRSKLPEGSPFRFYNGNVTTLSHSLQQGGHGASVISAGFYPWFHAWLVNQYDLASKRSDAFPIVPTPAMLKVQMFLTVADVAAKVNYPCSAKTYLSRYYKLGIQPTCRSGAKMPDAAGAAGAELLMRLDEVHRMSHALADELGIVPFASE